MGSVKILKMCFWSLGYFELKYCIFFLRKCVIGVCGGYLNLNIANVHANWTNACFWYWHYSSIFLVWFFFFLFSNKIEVAFLNFCKTKFNDTLFTMLMFLFFMFLCCFLDSQRTKQLQILQRSCQMFGF
jgi:hypothetical protein